MIYLAIGFAFGVLWLAACLLWLRHEDEWASAEREAAERSFERIIDIEHYRRTALRVRVERDVREAIAHAETQR